MDLNEIETSIVWSRSRNNGAQIHLSESQNKKRIRRGRLLSPLRSNAGGTSLPIPLQPLYLRSNYYTKTQR